MNYKLSLQIETVLFGLEVVLYILYTHREEANLACENAQDHWALI